MSSFRLFHNDRAEPIFSARNILLLIVVGSLLFGFMAPQIGVVTVKEIYDFQTAMMPISLVSGVVLLILAGFLKFKSLQSRRQK